MLYYEDPGEKTAVSIDIDRYIEPEGGWDFPGRRFFAERTRQRYFNDDIENVVLQRSFEDPITEGTLDSSSAVHKMFAVIKYVCTSYKVRAKYLQSLLCTLPFSGPEILISGTKRSCRFRVDKDFSLYDVGKCNSSCCTCVLL